MGHRLFMDFIEVYDLVRNEALYNIIIKFGATIKLFNPTCEASTLRINVI